MQRRLKPQMNTDKHRLAPEIRGDVALYVFCLDPCLSVSICGFIRSFELSDQLKRSDR